MKELFEYDKNKRDWIIKELNWNKKFRMKYFEQNFFSFALFYFPMFFTVKSAEFHKEWAKQFSSWINCLLIAFRESWKTIWLMVYLIWIIAYKKKRFILYYSYEQTLSAARLFDIIVQLKTNKRLINDFWHLFPTWKKTEKEDMGLEKKTVNEFITTNGIKLKSMSIWTTSRWQNYSNKEWSYRPDMLILDDIDTSLSVINTDVIEKNFNFLENEIIWWLDSEAQIIFLWNVITNDWIVPRFEDKVKWTSWYISRVAVLDWKGELTWDRFVFTNKEVEEYKKKWIKKISLEKKREDQGENYNPNMMLIPNLKYWNPVFDLDIVSLYKVLDWIQDDKYKDLLWFKKINIWDRWYMGVDTAKGWKKWDFATIIVRDFDFNLVCSYQERIAPDLLVSVIDYIYEIIWSNWIIAIENNNTWISTVDKAKETRLEYALYREKEVDTVTGKTKNKYWFNTNGKSKTLIITDYEENLRHWRIDLEQRIKDECLTYYYDQEGKMNALKGKHDDLVMADAICNYVGKKDKE